MSLLIIDNESTSSEHIDFDETDLLHPNTPIEVAPLLEPINNTANDPDDQDETKEDKRLLNLSFSGGGFKGAAFLGCVKALYEQDMMKNVSSVAGTSVGAMTATLLACKADYQYMRSCLLGILKHFENYRISWYSILKHAKNVNDDFGIYPTDDLRAYFMECIKNATHTDIDLTFIQLYKLTGIKLMITATCLDSQTPFYFSHETTKDTPISEALTISVNIPLLFTSKKFESKTLVDGCIIENLPMQCWPESELDNTIAFLVKSKNEVYKNDTDTIDNVYEYIQKLMASMKKYDDAWYYDKFKDTITVIMAGNISAYKTIPSKEDIHTVIHSAYFQTIKTLQTRGFLESQTIPQGGFISSFIVADDIDSETDSESDDLIVQQLQFGYHILTISTILLIVLILIRFWKKL